jgi:hypothetical protein
MMKNVVASNLLPMMSSMETTPQASIGLPPMPLSVKLVFTNSSPSLPSFLKTEYGIRLMATPLSMSILEIGFPSMCPQTYNGFRCWLDSSGFLNMASLGPKLI